MTERKFTRRHLLTVVAAVFVLITIIFDAPIFARLVGVVTLTIAAYGTLWVKFRPAGLILKDDAKSNLRRLDPSLIAFVFSMIANIGAYIGKLVGAP